jgi:hypothetical protein
MKGGDVRESGGRLNVIGAGLGLDAVDVCWTQITVDAHMLV